MIQGNICYRLVASTNYRPGATGATAGPQNGEMPISGVYVAPGAATLDFYDINGNRNQIAIGAANTGVFLPISVYQTGSSLSGTIFGFSAGNPYGNTVATGYVGPVS
jgi:hypothetical protein